MQLNPYNLKRYLRARPEGPTVTAWVVFAVFMVLVVAWGRLYMAPDAVAVDLPKAVHSDLQTPPSAFAVLTSNGIIYRNRLLTRNGFLQAIAQLPNKDVLLLATGSQTPIEDILPILQEASALGFEEVAFSVRP